MPYLVGIVLLASLVLFPQLPLQTPLSGDYYVGPDGRDSNPGTPAAPFRSIQQALNLARPGEVIVLAPGVYYQDVASQRSGTAAAPITIRGPQDAVVKGAGGARVVEITHDHLTLEGFTIDGLAGSPTSRSGYRNKLLYVQGSAPRDGVTGLRVLRMTFANAGGECIRLRYFAQHNEIAHSTIRNCGVYDYRFDGGGKNGEGIYIGTAVNQRADGRNPTADLDQSHSNWVHHNRIDTQGNECVNIKEGAWGNIIEHNHCTGQRDPKAAGVNVQGHANIVRHNTIQDNLGAGVRLGGATPRDGINNEVYANVLRANEAGGIKVQALPQGQICDNQLSGHAGADVIGMGRDQFTPAAPCSAQAAPAAGQPTSPMTSSRSRDAQELSLPVAGVRASGDDGNVAANTLDQQLATRWSAKGDGQYIQYDLGEVATVSRLNIAFHKGDSRTARFQIELSADGERWSRAFAGRSRDTTLQAQPFDLLDQRVRYVRIVGFGNSENAWNSLTEVAIYGAPAQ